MRHQDARGLSGPVTMEPMHTALIICLAAGLLALESCAQVSGASPVAASTATPGLSTPSPAHAGAAETGSAAALPSLPADPAGRSRVLTDYFKTHKLPLVGADVVDSGAGRQVILYGFVATPYGKRDAEDKARQIFNDSRMAVVNRITVRPELLTMNKSAASSEGATGSNGGGAENNNLSEVAGGQESPAPDQVQQYQQQQASWKDWIVPLLMIAAMLVP
jgi:hypothetical protein